MLTDCGSIKQMKKTADIFAFVNKRKKTTRRTYPQSFFCLGSAHRTFLNQLPETRIVQIVDVALESKSNEQDYKKGVGCRYDRFILSELAK